MTGVIALDALDDAPSPTALVATTTNVYAVPFVRPVTVAVRVVPPTVTVAPPGLAVTRYSVVSIPPVEDGAAQLTIACALPAIAVTLVDAPGTVAGVTTLDALEDAPAPTALIPTTVKVYAVPLVSVVKVPVGVEPPTVTVCPEGLAVTV